MVSAAPVAIRAEVELCSGSDSRTPVEDGLNILLRHSVLAAVPDGRLEKHAHREGQLGCNQKTRESMVSSVTQNHSRPSRAHAHSKTTGQFQRVTTPLEVG
jgi:hypothetical protein